MKPFETGGKKKKKIRQNQRMTKDGIIRDSRTLFEQREDYYEPKRQTWQIS